MICVEFEKFLPPRSTVFYPFCHIVI